MGKTTGQGEEQARRWVQPTLTKLLLKMKLERLPSSGIEGLCSSGRGEFPKSGCIWSVACPNPHPKRGPWEAYPARGFQPASKASLLNATTDPGRTSSMKQTPQYKAST